ncbi:hypothetical protein BGZ59_011470 [Podila verticillata]|nr:hypothetical protein BGZ59_011470 [Podila verticillata]KFH73697.1 hypothetical protein MVEG_00911 [Podila verticillata NRRL 6337]
MKFFAAVATLLVAAVANAQGPTWTNCATPGTTDLVINSFSVTPYPLCINQNVCASGTGTLLTDVIAPAKLAISGKFLGRVVYTDNQDLCAISAAAGLPCPIDTTHTSITACVLVKPSAPANVNVQLTVQATNGNNRVLFCQSATVTASNCA